MMKWVPFIVIATEDYFFFSSILSMSGPQA